MRGVGAPPPPAPATPPPRGAEIAVADIVRQDEHNVGLLLGMSRDYEGGQRQRKQGKGNPIARSHGNISWYRRVAYLNLTRISGISSELIFISF